MASLRARLLFFASLALMACSPEAPPRPQAVVYAHTDLPVPQLVDTVRIERLDGSGRVLEMEERVVPNASDWPISFGVRAEASGPVRLRVRLFSATRITTSPEARGATEPMPNFTVDRLVQLTVPAEGIARVELLLSGECLGIPADVAAGTSCVPGVGLAASAEAGLVALAQPPRAEDNRVGTWSALSPRPCRGRAREGREGLHEEDVCIPGGVFFLGDGRIGTSLGTLAADPTPERLVHLSPFFLDRYEVTVGRWRAALAAGFAPPADQWWRASDWRLCHFSSDNARDALPMNCVTWEAARAFCEFDGGRLLPTEAQWEFAASGRGEERLYVWGDGPAANCELASYARLGPSVTGMPDRQVLGAFNECTAHRVEGAAAVGSFPADATREGVLDMAGNISELVADERAGFDTFASDCWPQGILRDPVCQRGGAAQHILRGGNWASGSEFLAVANRQSFHRENADPSVHPGSIHPATGYYVGFRCARPDTP
jgi:formylglycine-generating enzyme required for sulfatase activity